MFPPTEENVIGQLEAQGHLGDFPMVSSAGILEETINDTPEGIISPEEQAAQAEREAQEAQAAEEEINAIIRELIKKAEDEDVDLRVTPLNMYKRNTLYFNNIQNIFLDPVAHDYRTLNSVLEELTKEGVNLDIKYINVYRAYVESIVAALSVDVPAVEFAPDDADNPEDIETQKTYERISVVVQRHNHSALMLIKALILLMNQGTIFGRNYRDMNPKYGTYAEVTETRQKAVAKMDVRCFHCGELLESGLNPQEVDQNTQVPCQACGMTGPPDLYQTLGYIDEPVNWEDTPKGRTKFDIFGPTYVKVPLYAREANSCGYLIYRHEDHIAKFKAEYENPNLSDKHDSDSYERWARLPLEYNNMVPMHIATKRECWFRPWYFMELGEEQAGMLGEKYPNGLKVTIIGEDIVKKEEKELEDEWTISFDPRSDFIHAEPLGNTIVPIQDAENDTFNLGLQCIEYGVPETFAHPKTLNFQKYGESKAAPGMVSPALPYAPDKNLSDGFHTIKTATLSGEYSTFEKGLENKGQFVSGAMASIFGGQATGSKTAAEYSQSRAQALQRLQIPFRSIKVFWSDLIYKCCVDFAQNMREDEKYTEKKGGTYVTTWINKTSLTGKVGQVTPDMNETLPQSWAQKREFIQLMIEKAPEMTGEILMHPNNALLFKKFTAIDELYIPGQEDAHKQNREIQDLIKGMPIGPMQSSVPIDVRVDDHAVHKLVLKNFLVSPVGMGLPPEAYQNCIMHYTEHEMAEQAKTMGQVGGIPPGEEPPSAAPSDVSNEGI